jgi:hypothetical protein
MEMKNESSNKVVEKVGFKNINIHTVKIIIHPTPAKLI